MSNENLQRVRSYLIELMKIVRIDSYPGVDDGDRSLTSNQVDRIVEICNFGINKIQEHFGGFRSETYIERIDGSSQKLHIVRGDKVLCDQWKEVTGQAMLNRKKYRERLFDIDEKKICITCLRVHNKQPMPKWLQKAAA